MRVSVPTGAFAAVVASLAWTPSFAEAVTPAPAQSEMIVKLKANDIASIVRDAGYRAEVVTENNRTRIRTGMSGYNVNVYLYGCDDEAACNSIQFSLGLTKSPSYTLSIANKWNQDKRFTKAYLDTGGNLFMEADVYFRGGVSRDALIASTRLFDDLVADFRSVLNALNNPK
jgi:putative sensory transduction regulator